MVLNIGTDFKTRWLKAPVDVRQTYIDELNHVCDLLLLDTDFSTWQKDDEALQKESKTRIETAYANYKAELIEAARIRQQNALEQSIHLKRQQEQAFIDQIMADETHQQQQEKDTLYKLQQTLHQEYSQYTSQYKKVALATPTPSTKSNKNKTLQPEIQQLIENIQIRLELEAEGLMQQIQQAVHQLSHQLQHAAEEELDIALQQKNKS